MSRRILPFIHVWLQSAVATETPEAGIACDPQGRRRWNGATASFYWAAVRDKFCLSHCLRCSYDTHRVPFVFFSTRVLSFFSSHLPLTGINLSLPMLFFPTLATTRGAIVLCSTIITQSFTGEIVTDNLGLGGRRLVPQESPKTQVRERHRTTAYIMSLPFGLTGTGSLDRRVACSLACSPWNAIKRRSLLLARVFNRKNETPSSPSLYEACFAVVACISATPSYRTSVALRSSWSFCITSSF